MTDFDPYYTGLLEIASMYKQDKDTVIKMLLKFDVPATILNSLYFYLLGRGEIAPIEDLPAFEKAKLWQESTVLETKYKRMKYVRANYLLNLL